MITRLELGEADTFPKLLRRNYHQYGDNKPALRKKRYGIWRSFSWQDYYENVKYFALGLMSLGFERGQNVAILGDNDPEWWYAALAAQSLGGVQYGIYVDCVASEVEYFVQAGRATMVVVKDQEQCDKLLEIKDNIPEVRKVIYWEPKGMWRYDDDFLMEFTDVLELGRAYEKEHPSIFEESIDAGQATDISCFSFTSGTTGLPKPAMIAYETLTRWTDLMLDFFPLYEGDDYFSFLCPAWGMDQWLGIGAALMVGWTVNFPEQPETIKSDAREISSHFQGTGARAWEETYRETQVRISDADIIKRTFYKLFLPVGLKVADLRYENKEPGLLLKTLYTIGDWLVFRQLRDKLGVKRARICLVAGAMMSPQLFRYWRAIGIPLYTNYAMTEAGVVALEAPGRMRYGSSGLLLDRGLKISDDGEILVKADELMFSGYYQRPEATEEKIQDGWMSTGDSGYVDDDGYLFFIDRMDDLSALANGSKFSPTYIEANLRFSTYIKDVMVVGTDREHVSALVDIDLGNCGKFAEQNRIVYTTRVDLSQKKEIYDLIKGEIEKTNKAAPEHSRVKKFVNLHKEFDPDEAEMTRTRKLKRNVLEDKYKDIIQAIYSPGVEQFKVETEVKYRDGRKGIITTELSITEAQ